MMFNIRFCLFWTVWRERNRTVFDDEKPSIQRIKAVLLIRFGPGLGWLQSLRF